MRRVVHIVQRQPPYCVAKPPRKGPTCSVRVVQIVGGAWGVGLTETGPAVLQKYVPYYREFRALQVPHVANHIGSNSHSRAGEHRREEPAD